ncbi:DUF6884 domain-containing protein [Kitasatospora phosalacinea]|uniref:DUF6884 domain-containing protein n=1 Tax=Kitasatospora phosalacinea TaxID=2065 RepID=A0A9W6PNC8_9ACTN|nr:DUF6884 domain-containing protein [Kitasatospora phosalacinea]GLW58206.1 hypothetical protein Kpho01_62170 [Kitasatospora phosalacinea]
MPKPTDPLEAVSTAARGIQQAMADWDAVNDSYCGEDGQITDTDGWESGIVARDLTAWHHFQAVLEHGIPFLILTKDLLRPNIPHVTHAHRALVQNLSSAYRTLHRMIDSPHEGDHPLREDVVAEIWHEMAIWAEHAPVVLEAHRREAVNPPKPTLARSPRRDGPQPVRAATTRMPDVAHAAVLSAAAQPEHLLGARLHQRTADYLIERGMAQVRPLPDGHRITRDHQFALAVHLTEAGRQYALEQGARAPRRRAVVVACGSRKAAPTPGASTVPAGDLYTGSYHRALRRTAEVLTDHWGTVYILSAQAGLVPTDRLLAPYDLRITDPRAVTGEQLRHQADAFDLEHADVIFLGGGKYAHALAAAVPHRAMPLASTRGMGEQLQLLKHARADTDDGLQLRTAWWAQADFVRTQQAVLRSEDLGRPAAAPGSAGRPLRTR